MTRETAEHLAVRTTDFDETVATMRAAFGDVDLRRDDEGKATFSMRSVRTCRLASSRWHLTGVSGGSRDEDALEEETVLTGIRLGGGLRMWSRWNDVDVGRPFLYPDRVDSVLDGPDISNLGLARSVVLQHARAMSGIDDLELRFTGIAPIDASLDQAWRDTAAYTARTMVAWADRPDLELVEAGLAGMVATILLRTFPSTALEAMERSAPVRSVAPVLRRAVQFIDDNLDAPISVPDIAEAARLSSRGLYAAFRRDLDTTPMEYLRAGRLAAAHQELLDADPRATTVTDVALRWGFTNAGRFADRYRLAFDESPTDTLRR